MGLGGFGLLSNTLSAISCTRDSRRQIYQCTSAKIRFVIDADKTQVELLAIVRSIETLYTSYVDKEKGLSVFCVKRSIQNVITRKQTFTSANA